MGLTVILFILSFTADRGGHSCRPGGGICSTSTRYTAITRAVFDSHQLVSDGADSTTARGEKEKRDQLSKIG